MNWRLGAIACTFLGHRYVVWTNAPFQHQLIVCTRCHEAWRR